MKRLFTIMGLVAFMASCSSGEEQEFIADIEASVNLFSLELVGDNQYSISESRIGEVVFGQLGDRVRISISLEEMTPNTSKAVHIHDGTLETPGIHWNQGSVWAACDSVSLGGRWGKPFIGDVGNVDIDSEGNGEFVLFTDLWRINSGDNMDLLNKVIIIHENPQDFDEECNPNHTHGDEHTNPKIAGGVISLDGSIASVTKSMPNQRLTSVPDFLICK